MPGATVESMLAYLNTLNADQLQTILENRRDTLYMPWPSHMSLLAERLLNNGSVINAYNSVALPHVEVLGAITLADRLERKVTVENVAALLDGEPEAVQRSIDHLQEHLLVWPAPNGRLATPRAFPVVGLRLGVPVRTMLGQSTLATLRSVATKLRIRGDGPLPQVIDRIAEFLRDAEAVRRLVDTAPEDDRLLILDCAINGTPVVYSRTLTGSYGTTANPKPGEWAVARGLLWADYDGFATMPVEVALALRGEQRLPFHPDPPTFESHPVEAAHLDAEAATNLLRLLELIQIVLDSATAEKIPLIKSGAIGIRTIRTLAKENDAEADQVAVALELAYAQLILVPNELPPPPKRRTKKSQMLQDDRGLVPGPWAAAWSAATPQQRGAMILSRWWNLGFTLMADPKIGDDVARGPSFLQLRNNIFRVLSELEPAHGAGSIDQVVPLMAWKSPYLPLDAVQHVLSALAHEAEMLGVIALGALTSLGRALVEGDVESAVAALISGAHSSAVIGADLTAVVFGPPASELSRFLDSVATRESQGGATMWRFTPESIRSAFDAGATSSELLDQLTTISESGIPQALEYMITDVARTHGSMRVVELGSAVIADDPTLLLEIVGNRKLSKLELSLLAPTVVASRADAATTLAQLRAAGYSPVTDEKARTIQISTVTEEPSTIYARQHVGIAIAKADPVRIAAHLVASSSEPVGAKGHRWEYYEALKGRASSDAITLLALGRVCRIEFGNQVHVVHSARLHDGVVTAWSVTTDRYEDFPISKISVSKIDSSPNEFEDEDDFDFE
ncbi:helicase-associated domain-containing protein [Antrihabitans sp. NCIMB 15449]|uniref:Helicase-associated domain-containing protein n=1 Tax=Antrihabitans spumae TaxID=3373370 RepID=A0ABW7JRA8_9NOCA